MRAVRTSASPTLIAGAGSTAVTIGSMVRLVCVVAKCKALYQSVKKALISAGVSLLLAVYDLARKMEFYILKIVLRIYRTCGAILGSRSGASESV